MADIEIGPLTDRLGEDEIGELQKALKKAGAPKLNSEDDGDKTTIAANLDEDVLADFLDRLEAYDMACDIYLPSEFEGRVDVGELKVGSAPALLEVMEELKEELGLEEEDEGGDDDEDEEEEEEEEDDYGGEIKLMDEQIHRLWRIVYEGANAAIDRNLPLFVKGR